MSNVSNLGHNIDRLGSMLRKTASSQIEEYRHRFSSMAALYDTVFKDLIIDKYDVQQAYITAHKFFGKDNVNFVAIDGTEYSKPMFDMVIFYAGTTKLNTSPNDVTVIMITSMLPLPCVDLKYVVIKLSKPSVRCEATIAVSVTKIITNTINCIDLISIIQVGHRLDNGNNWF